jgi:iron complex transport system substrate-binding protein
MTPHRTGNAPPRVASLLPSATEIVCALGLREALVGVSHECDFPESVAGLPVLTSSRLPAREGTGVAGPESGGVDREIRKLLADGLAIYTVDVAALERAAPDVIVTQDLCEVCAVSFEDVKAAARKLASPSVRIVNLRPTRLAEILGSVLEVGRALDRGNEAAEVVAGLNERIDAVRRRAERAVRASQRPPPNVLTIEWLDPVMVGGTWMPELVEIAGGRALVTKPGDHAPTLAREDLARLAPDVVLIKPCGYALERSRREVGTLRDAARAFRWPAAETGNLWLADGSAYFNRPGPRIVDSLEILAACVHPEEFGDLAARHGRGFERVR